VDERPGACPAALAQARGQIEDSDGYVWQILWMDAKAMS
jgi:predicted lactoylglutathione lyase